jgi:hypothetical protein
MATAPAVTGSGTLSYSQLKGVWLQAAQGTRYAGNAWASLMAAIAEAESGGRPTATNPYDNGGSQTSWGLWQISLGNHEAPSPNWADPSENAKLAIGKLNSQGLSAWGTYDSGAYEAYLSDKTAADLTDIPTGPDAASQGQLTAQASQSANCAWKINLLGTLPSWIPFVGGDSPGVCVLSKSQARAVLGTALVLGGSLIVLAGLGVTLAAAAIPLAGKVAPLVAPEAGAAAAAGATTRARS